MILKKINDKAWLITVIFLFTIVGVAVSFANIDASKPWHVIQQIAIDDVSKISIDQDANGRIDAGIIEDTLQDITNNGAETTNAITVGGLNVIGTSSFTGHSLFNSDTTFLGEVSIKNKTYFEDDVVIASITNCQTDLITDANGKLTCGNDYDKQSDNELITSISLSFDTQTNYLSLTLHEGTSNSKTASISLASLATIPTLSEVLDAGNDAQGKDINNVGSLKAQELCLNGDCKNSWDDVGLWKKDASGNIYYLGGNVGIGTNAPTQKLDVNGMVKIRGSDLQLGTNDGRTIGSKPSQRALVHYYGDTLVINYNGDFEGGVRIDSVVKLKNHIYYGRVPLSLLTCDNNYIIPDGCIHDGGISGEDDNLEIYCVNGIARFCLSHEACPWRYNKPTYDNDDLKTCSRAGLTSDWMAYIFCSDKYYKGQYKRIYCDANGNVYFGY